MFCKKCGKQLPDNTTFCSGCGAQLKPSSNSRYEGGKPLEDGKIPVVPPIAQPVKPVEPVFNMPMNMKEPEPPEENKSKKGIIIAVVAIVLAIALIAGGFFLIKYFKDKDSDDDDTSKREKTSTQFEITTVTPITVNPDDFVITPDVEVVTDENGEVVTDHRGEVVTVRPSDIKPGETTTDNFSESTPTTKPNAIKPETTKPNNTKPTTTRPSPNSWTSQQILDLYNSAVKKTDPKAPKGNSKLMLVGSMTGDGAIGSIIKVLEPMITSALAQNSIPTNFVPGAGNIKASDIKSIKISETGSTYIVEMTIKDQTDGASADDKSGPVGRAIGTFGDITGELKDLGIEFKSGLDTLTIKYTDAKIRAVMDKNSGLITSGNWHYVANVKVANANASVAVINAVLKNFSAKIDYTVVI